MEPTGRYNNYMYYEDEIVTTIGLLYSIILLIIVIVRYKVHTKTQKNMTKNVKRYNLAMKISLFATFISNVLYMFATFLIINLHSILPNYDHHKNLIICHAQHIITSIIVACYLCSILIYFSIRLQVMLAQTPYQYPSKWYIVYRLIVFITIFTLGIASCLSYKGSYIVSVDDINSSNPPLVCSGVESTQLTTMGLVIAGGLFWTFILNVVIWYMFVKKLIVIIKSKHMLELEASKSNISETSTATTTLKCDSKDERAKVGVVVFDEYQLTLLGVIKKQTLLVTIICLSTITFWGIHSLFLYGYISLMCDAIINVSCIFLSLVFTKCYYEMLKCDKCADKCCGCVQQYAVSNVMKAIEMKKEIKSTSCT